jgi:hypothetical protein
MIENEGPIHAKSSTRPEVTNALEMKINPKSLKTERYEKCARRDFGDLISGTIKKIVSLQVSVRNSQENRTFSSVIFSSFLT